MPLIIITGLPASGKSYRAAQLHSYLSERISSSSSSSTTTTSEDAQAKPTTTTKYRLHLISDETQSIPRSVYDLSALPQHVRSANAQEKDARASVYAAVKRVLSPRDIVILDGLNYIKGWRYQLYTEAKNLATPSVVLQIGCSVDRARETNEGRRKDGGGEGEGEGGEETARGGYYSRENFDNLVFRYEEPNPMTRWDSPLFTLIWEDDEERARSVYEKIWDVIAGKEKVVVRPNQSTVQRDKDPGGEYLYVLERETQDIVKRILERQNEVGEGAEVVLKRNGDGKNKDGGGGEEELVLQLPGKKVGLPQLQRYRRAFVALNRGGIGLEMVGKLQAGRLRESFVGYLNDAFEKDG